jgi:hypothetical protein
MFYERRRIALADSLTTGEWQAMATDATLERRRREIDSLTTVASEDPRNAAAADALSRALDGWYFDVQQLRRGLKRR